MVMMSGTILMIAGAAAAAAEDGAALFVKNCQTCHIIAKDGPVRTGPPLRGVIGRKAGTVEGFSYSAGLKASGIIWTRSDARSVAHLPEENGARHHHALSPEQA